MKKKDNLKAFILLDSSGSMGGNKWSDSIGSVNAYARGLRPTDEIVFATFSGGLVVSSSFIPPQGIGLEPGSVDPSTITVHYSGPVSGWKDYQPTDIIPSGGTPLYDASWAMFDVAEAANGTKKMVIFITDGQENASKVIKTSSEIKNRLESFQTKGFEVVFLGNNFDDVVYQSQSLGGMFGKTISVDSHNMRTMMSGLAANGVLYASSTDYTLNYNDADRAMAKAKL